MQSGSCHCGAVTFTVQGEIDTALECNCSHCSRKGYLLWFVPAQALDLRSGEQELATYTFNRHVIQHRFCRICGSAPFGLGTGPDGQATAAINIRCVDDIDLAAIERVPFNGREL